MFCKFFKMSLLAIGLESGTGNAGSVVFSGTDYLKYYWSYFQTLTEGYTWQIKSAFLILLLACLMMLVLFIMFGIKIKRRRERIRQQARIDKNYYTAVRSIIEKDEMTYDEMIEMLGADEETLRKNDPKYYVTLMANIRTEKCDIPYLPNILPLAELLGVRDYIEMNLQRGNNVFNILQEMLFLQLNISEGRLANCVNDRNPDIRMLARLNYIMCSESNPYKYLQEDLNDHQSLLRPMILHHIFGWMKARNRRMPNFIMLADNVENHDTAAFLLQEVAYWGNPAEQAQLSEYLLSAKKGCRSAAIKALAILKDSSAEEKMISTFDYQPENVRVDIMNALLSIKSGNQVSFYENVYNTSASRSMRELALACLYEYGEVGRRKFEEIRMKASDEEKVLLDQIETSSRLNED